MNQVVILKLGKGSCEDGFSTVIVQLFNQVENTTVQLMGNLPPVPNLPVLYQQWQKLYFGYRKNFHWRKNNIEFEEEEVAQFSEEEFRNISSQLKQCLNSWLQYAEFNKIELVLRTKLNENDHIRLIIETDNLTLSVIPWHLWDLVEDYSHVEVSLSMQQYRDIKITQPKSRHQVRIMAVLGNSVGLDVQKDQKLLQSLPHSNIVFLVEPTGEELNRWLWDKNGWDIFFFAGHSYTDYCVNSGMGKLQLRESEFITIEELKHGLKKAINGGLTLAIFNSCEGFGLAKELFELNLPQIIVMREPVPDQVAHEFLKNFLLAFSENQPFHLAVREAREKLQALEKQFPYASWLPLICQNPMVEPPTWSQLYGKSKIRKLYPHSPIFYIVGFIVLLGMALGWWFYGGKMIDFSPSEMPDNFPDDSQPLTEDDFSPSLDNDSNDLPSFPDSDDSVIPWENWEEETFTEDEMNDQLY